MKIRRFFGKDMRDALKQVKDELGGDAVIMSNKKVANGVELVAAIDPASGADLGQATALNQGARDNRLAATNHPATAATNDGLGQRPSKIEAPQQATAELTQGLRSKQGSAASLREIIGDSGPDSLKALLEQQLSTSSPSLPTTSRANSQADAQAAESIRNQYSQASETQMSANMHGSLTSTVHASDRKSLHYSQQPDYGSTPEPRADERIFRSPAFCESSEESAQYAHNNNQASGIGVSNISEIVPPPSVLEPAQLDTIRAELESIKNVLKYQVSELADERKKRHNPVHHYLHSQLIKMGVSKDLAKQFIEFLPYQIDEKQGWKYVLNLLSNRLHVGGNDILNKSGVVALVGPTGTGKTTTVAKLAAKYAQKYGPEQVALVTIDTYRIAAFEQLATYGKIIGCAVKKAHNAQELNDILYQMRNKKLVLIDTAGFSQRDVRLIQQLNEYEQNLNIDIRKFLVLPAGSQYQVLNQTVKAYRSTHISGCIFSKLDECYSMGEALSVIIENDLSLSYVTDGQRVPEDIKLADAANLTLIAAKLFKRYGNGDVIACATETAGAI